MKKIKFLLLATLVLSFAFISCQRDPEIVYVSEPKEITYTGTDLLYLLGIGETNASGDVEITPNGYNTKLSFGYVTNPSYFDKIIVNAKLSKAEGVQGVLQLTNHAMDSVVNNSSSPIKGTTFANYEISDFSKATDKLVVFQPYCQETTSGNYNALSDVTITIHSVTIILK